MNVGDSRHATLLTIIALGAVGFVIIQIIPARSGAAASGSAPTADDGALLRNDQPLSTSLTTDPFTHPAYAIDRAKAVAKDANAKRATAGAALADAESPGLGVGIMPPVMPPTFDVGPQPATSIRPDSTAIPEKNTGANQQFNQTESVSIVLQAVLEVKEQLAFIAVDGEEARAFRRGDSIADGARLVGFWSDGVIVSRRGKSFRIPVGGNTEAMKGWMAISALLGCMVTVSPFSWLPSRVACFRVVGGPAALATALEASLETPIARKARPVATRPDSPDPAVLRSGPSSAPLATPLALPDGNGTKASSVEDTVCSLNAEKLDLAQALRQISTMTHANLLLLTSTDQKLTIRLTEVKMIDMLRHVCALTGMRFLKVGPTYVVATEDKLKSAYPEEWNAAYPPPPAKVVVDPPKPITTLVLLKNVTGDKAAEVIKKAFPAESLTVVPGPQYISPSLQARQAGSQTGVSGTAVERLDNAGMSKAVVLMGPPDIVAAAKEMLETIDHARKQVVINVSIHDITNDALKDLGIPWSFGDVSISESSPNGLNLGSFSRAPQSLSGQLKALEKTTAAKLLAAPTLSVLDGESAFILIGDKINYPVLVGYSQANTPIFSKETERVGIYLQLACQVGQDGTITLTVYPQVSTVTGYLEVNGASYPQIATREAQTTLSFRSGETVVMGGLIKDEDIRIVEKVPILSQIPFIGEIFSHRKKTKTSSQVIITITPIILDDK